MKWTNHAQLQVYGVRLEGWPSDIPHANPSTLSVAQNTVVRDAIDRGTMRFVRLDIGAGAFGTSNEQAQAADRDEDGDMWDVVSEDGGMGKPEDERGEARKRPRLDEGPSAS